jgi:alkylation response protein AidB-like acyl-CoA dehydrogenase
MALAGSTRTVDMFIESARRLIPRIKTLRRDIEHDRTLPSSLVAEMGNAGLFSLWLARAFGGPELTMTEYARVIETLSSADGSVGWCAMIAAAYSRFSGYLAEDVARDIFRDDHTIVAGTIGPVGKATVARGGFRLNGRWSYGSFIHHSQWVVSGAIVHDANGPRRDASGKPDIRYFFFPMTGAEIIDTWHVSGLRGTGSHDYRVNDLFVPDDLVIPVLDQKPVQSGALYFTPLITVFAACIGCVAIGIARAAIDAFVTLAHDKTPLGSSALLRDKPSAQIDLARAEALLRAGRAFLFEAVEGLWDEAAAGRPCSLRQRALVRVATAQAAAMSTQAVDLLYNASGASALFETNPLERCFRDVHATTQHIATSGNNFETGGRILFGLDPGTFAL